VWGSQDEHQTMQCNDKCIQDMEELFSWLSTDRSTQDVDSQLSWTELQCEELSKEEGPRERYQCHQKVFASVVLL